MRRMVAAIAAYERAIIAARTRAALAAKRAKGERTGTERYGRDETERAILIVINDCRAAGFSLKDTAEELNRRGYSTRKGTPWQAPYVRSILGTAAGIKRSAKGTGQAARVLATIATSL
jgi:DNA invertase Pin-like site-specific DNA recombinase